MKKKFEKNKRRNAIILLLTTMIIACSIFYTLGMVFPSQSVIVGKSQGIAGMPQQSSSNIKTETIDNGDYIVKEYTFTLPELGTTPNAITIKEGTQLETEDYIYTYGYYWSSQPDSPLLIGESVCEDQ